MQWLDNRLPLPFHKRVRDAELIAVVPHARHAVVAAEVLALALLSGANVECASDSVRNEAATTNISLADLSVTITVGAVITLDTTSIHWSNVLKATCTTKSTITITIRITHSICWK